MQLSKTMTLSNLIIPFDDNKTHLIKKKANKIIKLEIYLSNIRGGIN